MGKELRVTEIYIANADNRIYLRNAYRVLLTRARQGMVIFAGLSKLDFLAVGPQGRKRIVPGKRRGGGPVAQPGVTVFRASGARTAT